MCETMLETFLEIIIQDKIPLSGKKIKESTKFESNSPEKFNHDGWNVYLTSYVYYQK